MAAQRRAARVKRGRARSVRVALGAFSGSLLGVALLVVLALVSTSGFLVAPAAARAEAGYGRGVPSGVEPIGRFWPVEGSGRSARPVMSRGWQPPPSRWAAGHRGVDLTTRPGRPVRAIAGGRVSFAGEVAGRGVLSIELAGTGHPPVRTTYEPVRPSVHKGDRVRPGETVATTAGGTAHCHGGCLHWGARRGEHYLDPLSLLPANLLRGAPSRLLPVFGVPLPPVDAASPGGTAAGGRVTRVAVPVRGQAPPKRAARVEQPMREARVAAPGGTGATAAALMLCGAACWARRRLARCRPRASPFRGRPP